MRPTEHLQLDALELGDPAEVVADCLQVGARWLWVYAARFAQDGTPLPTFATPAHVQALHAAGIGVGAIIVPGGAPKAVEPMLAAAHLLGTDPVVVFDVETFSLASPQWLGAALAIAAGQLWLAMRYGDSATLAGYPLGNGDWISHLPGNQPPVEAGILEPIPDLPLLVNLVSWQYAVRVTVNGRSYDASVASNAAFFPTLTPIPQEMPMDRLLLVNVTQGLGTTPYPGVFLWLLSGSGSLYFHLVDDATRAALQAAPILTPMIEVSLAEHQNILAAVAAARTDAARLTGTIAAQLAGTIS